MTILFFLGIFADRSYSTYEFPNELIVAYSNSSSTVPILGFDYNIQSIYREWKVSTNYLADFYLVDPENFGNIKNRRAFRAYWSLKSSGLGQWKTQTLLELSLLCVL